MLNFPNIQDSFNIVQDFKTKGFHKKPSRTREVKPNALKHVVTSQYIVFISLVARVRLKSHKVSHTSKLIS